MAQARMISTDISVSDRVNRLSDKAVILYTWSIPHTDYFRLIPASPRRLKRDVVPYRDNITNEVIQQCIDELVKERLFIKFTYEGNDYFYVPDPKNTNKFRQDRKPITILPVNVSGDTKKMWATIQNLIEKLIKESDSQVTSIDWQLPTNDSQVTDETKDDDKYSSIEEAKANVDSQPPVNDSQMTGNASQMTAEDKIREDKIREDKIGASPKIANSLGDILDTYEIPEDESSLKEWQVYALEKCKFLGIDLKALDQYDTILKKLGKKPEGYRKRLYKFIGQNYNSKRHIMDKVATSIVDAPNYKDMQPHEKVLYLWKAFITEVKQVQPPQP